MLMAIIYINGQKKNLPNDSIILTTHRSYLYSEIPFVSYDFRLYASTQEDINYYLKSVIKKKTNSFII